MKLVLHGTLRDRFGESVEIETDTVADALEGWSRQAMSGERMVVEVIDFDTDEKLHAKTDVDEVHVIPAMYGGGGKFMSIIVGAIQVVVGILLLPSAIGVALIVSGATMVLMGIVNLFMKAPSVSKSDDPPASKYLGLNKNTVDIGTPITLAGGTIELFGHWLSIQSDSDKLVVGSFPTNPT